MFHKNSVPLYFFVVGIAAALHSPSKASPAFEVPNIREACTSSTSSTNLCLAASLDYRCYNYGNFSLLNLGEIRACIGGVGKMIDVMNLVQVPIGEDEKNPDDRVESSGLLLKQVLFQKDLEAIFNARETAGFFQAAQTDLQDSARFGRSHNLWDAVFAKSGNNRQKTLKFIAEAVQDVSFGIWHIMYLGRKYDAEKRSEKSVQVTNLKAAQEFIQLYQVNLEDNKNLTFSAYPAIDGAAKRIDTSLHPFLHHFYLPAFIASELKRLGKTDEQAFFAGFLLNTGYEFVKLDASLGSKRWPFHDPKKFDPKSQVERLRKIYTGYVGALWGVHQERHAKSFAEFSRDLAADPYGSMKSYFFMKF